MTSKILTVGNEPKPLRVSTPPPTTSPPNKPAKRTRQTSNRFAVVNAFVDLTLRGLSRGEIAVWLILWRDTKPEGTARTSQADLARRAGVEQRTVERTIRRLVDSGLVTVAYAGGLNRGPSVYRVHPLPPGRLPTPASG